MALLTNLKLIFTIDITDYFLYDVFLIIKYYILKYKKFVIRKLKWPRDNSLSHLLISIICFLFFFSSFFFNYFYCTMWHVGS